MGVAATVMGLGFRGCFGLEGAAGSAGRPEMCTSGFGLGLRRLLSGVGFSALASAGLSAASRLLAQNVRRGGRGQTSRAGMTSPSSAGAGSFAGSGWAGFLPRAPLLGCGTLRSRTVGAGTGCMSAPRPERPTSSCSFRACFCRSRARRSRASSSGAASPWAAARRPQSARTHSPSWKLVRKSRLMK